MPKNILLFADGTGNEGGLLPDESRTNVYKLYRAIRTGPDSIIHPKLLDGVVDDDGPSAERRWRRNPYFGP